MSHSTDKAVRAQNLSQDQQDVLALERFCDPQQHNEKIAL
jgi:hypothetical protein